MTEKFREDRGLLSSSFSSSSSSSSLDMEELLDGDLSFISSDNNDPTSEIYGAFELNKTTTKSSVIYRGTSFIFWDN